jgi:hypothetical protein
MEKFYICDQTDFNDIVTVMEMEHNSLLYGIDTTATGIKQMQIKRIEGTLRGNFSNGKIFGHRIDDKFVGFGAMYFWAGLPVWSIPIAYTSCGFFAEEKFAHTYSGVVKAMMELAESQGIYSYYFVAAYSTSIKSDGFRLRNYGRPDLFPRYEYNYDEIIPPYGDSKYKLFQPMLEAVGGRSRRSLAIVHGYCKQEYRKGPQ